MMLFLCYLNTTMTNNLRKDDPTWQGKKKELNDNFVWMLSPITKECRISNSFAATPEKHKRKHNIFQCLYSDWKSTWIRFYNTMQYKWLFISFSLVSVEQEGDQSECDSQNEYDSDCLMQEKSCNEFHNEDFTSHPKPQKVAFIVFWSSLLMLLWRCLHPTCFLPVKIKNF